uniref:BAR domain-containing protein n=1 Tax=Elaeophora elaphi TaxID=1147741 RepID=A0A0R3RGD8_9BILA
MIYKVSMIHVRLALFFVIFCLRFSASYSMDFNFKKIASDASGFFSRAKQLTEETFLKAEKTELDAHFENLLQRADKTEEHTKRLLSAMESYLQPNPTIRMEEVFYEKLELRKENRLNNLEQLGQAMNDAGNEFGAGTPYGSALLKVAQAEFKLGAGERDLINSCASNALLPIRRFLEGDMKTIQRERKVLNTKRLDLDAAKSRLRKAKSVEAQNNVSFTLYCFVTYLISPIVILTFLLLMILKENHFDVDHILRNIMQIFENIKAEADLRVVQAEFDKQAEITKLLLEGIQTAHNNHLKCLRDFVESQMSFYALAHQHMADLQRELSGAPDAESAIGLFGGYTGTSNNTASSNTIPTSTTQQTVRQPSSTSKDIINPTVAE